LKLKGKANFFSFFFFVCVSLRLTEKKPKNNLKTAKLFHRMRNETNFHFHAAHTQIFFFFVFGFTLTWKLERKARWVQCCFWIFSLLAHFFEWASVPSIGRIFFFIVGYFMSIWGLLDFYEDGLVWFIGLSVFMLNYWASYWIFWLFLRSIVNIQFNGWRLLWYQTLTNPTHRHNPKFSL